jgi:hypothetical protein
MGTGRRIGRVPDKYEQMSDAETASAILEARAALGDRVTISGAPLSAR